MSRKTILGRYYRMPEKKGRRKAYISLTRHDCSKCQRRESQSIVMECLGLFFSFTTIVHLEETSIHQERPSLSIKTHTLSRYCNTAMATAITSNVTPKAIPVCRIIRLAVTKSLLCHLNDKMNWLSRHGIAEYWTYLSGSINGVGMMTI